MFGDGGDGICNFFFGGGAIREGYRLQTWSKNPIMAPFSVYLSPDMSADALAIINILPSQGENLYSRLPLCTAGTFH